MFGETLKVILQMSQVCAFCVLQGGEDVVFNSLSKGFTAQRTSKGVLIR